jgi:hypothetical protein
MALKEVTLELTQGDSEDYLITVKDDSTVPVVIDLSLAVDGTPARPAIIRFAVKKDPASETNPEAIVFKSSYFADQISFLAQTGATLGQCRALVDKPDTQDVEAGAYRWDVEVTRQDALRAGASTGTIDVTLDSIIVSGTATAFTKAKVGDVLQPLGSLNTAPVKITKIISATSVEVEAALFVTESGISFEVRRGKHKTAGRGPFTLIQSVVAE